jgi:hypothetical protein
VDAPASPIDTPPPPQSDEELRLECARLVMVFGTAEDPIAATDRLFNYIKSGKQ